MLRTAIAGGLAALLLAAPPARPDDAKKQDVKALIAKAIEAKGGAANLEKYKAATAKFKATVSVQGTEVEMTGTTKDQAPDKTRIDASMKVGGQDVQYTQILNGDKAWQGTGGEPAEMDKDTLAELREQLYADRIADLRGLSAKGIKLAPLGESKVGDKPAVGVRVSSEGHRDVDLYFDKGTHLVLKSETKQKDPAGGGGEFKAETFYDDYKKADGLLVPRKIKVLRDGNPFMTMEITSVTLAESLPDKDFTKQ
jgi:hypothetical protein